MNINKRIYLISSDEVTKFYLNILNNIKKIYSGNIEDFIADRKVKLSLSKKNAYVIIEGEEIYIKHFEFPKADDEKLYSMINRELSYLYRNEKDLIFSYKKIRQNKNTVELIVFYLRTRNLNFIKDITKPEKLKAIRIIQFCFFEYYKKIIKENNYILCFEYNCNFYIIIVKDNTLYANGVYLDKTKGIYDKSQYIEAFINNNLKDLRVSSVYDIGSCIKDKKCLDFLSTVGKIISMNNADESKIMKLSI